MCTLTIKTKTLFFCLKKKKKNLSDVRFISANLFLECVTKIRLCNLIITQSQYNFNFILINCSALIFTDFQNWTGPLWLYNKEGGKEGYESVYITCSASPPNCATSHQLHWCSVGDTNTFSLLGVPLESLFCLALSFSPFTLSSMLSF